MLYTEIWNCIYRVLRSLANGKFTWNLHISIANIKLSHTISKWIQFSTPVSWVCCVTRHNAGIFDQSTINLGFWSYMTLHNCIFNPRHSWSWFFITNVKTNFNRPLWVWLHIFLTFVWIIKSLGWQCQGQICLLKWDMILVYLTTGACYKCFIDPSTDQWF